MFLRLLLWQIKEQKKALLLKSLWPEYLTFLSYVMNFQALLAPYTNYSDPWRYYGLDEYCRICSFKVTV